MKLNVKDNLSVVGKFARKQMASLICAAIMIVGIVLAYWPTQGWFTDLGQKMGQSLAMGSQIDGLISRQRNLPNVSLTAASGAPLTAFPTQDVIQKGLAAVKAFGDQSNAMLSSAVTINSHAPLVDGALPNGSDIARATFARVYNQALEDDNRIRNWPPPELRPPAYTIPPLMAGRLVDANTIAAAVAGQEAAIDAQYVGPNGQPLPDSTTQAQAAKDKLAKVMPLQMQREAAKKFKVYLEAGAIKPPPLISEEIKTATSSLPPDDLWTGQLWLWIDEDVATAVARANADATNVMDAPVKQILDVTIKDPPYLIVGDPTAGSDSTPLTPAPDATPTGRVCNGMYDVIQFSLTLDVDASRVPQVLRSLEKGQFITVLDVQTTSIDPGQLMLSNFVYGNCPTVRLNLACEELLLHSWLSAIQPPDAGASKYASTGGSPASSTTSLFPITVHATGQ